ncbi:MAG: pilus assembly protein PilP [Rhodocyclaceae bacterium]|nr:pilus assembly protein PilP [Rhodocyclaceae bacterium]
MKRRFLIALASLLLAACGSEEHSDIKQWMKESAKDMRGHVPPLPEVKPFPVVSYDAGDLPDPFRPSKIEPEKKAGGGGTKPDLERRKEELERYPLEAIKFVGLIRDARLLYAVVMVDKRIYRVKIGNYMGQDFGMVTDIKTSPGLDEGKLILKELVQDPSGDWVERETALEMQVQETTK